MHRARDQDGGEGRTGRQREIGRVFHPRQRIMPEHDVADGAAAERGDAAEQADARPSPCCAVPRPAPRSSPAPPAPPATAGARQYRSEAGPTSQPRGDFANQEFFANLRRGFHPEQNESGTGCRGDLSTRKRSWFPEPPRAPAGCLGVTEEPDHGQRTQSERSLSFAPTIPIAPNRADDEFAARQRLDNELQIDPELAEGPASSGRIALFAVAIAVVLGAVFYGLNNSSINQAGTSSDGSDRAEPRPRRPPPLRACVT